MHQPPLTTQPLSERELEILALERMWWNYPGNKESEIRRRFDVSATRYLQELNALLDRPEALAHDPLTVRRLQRLRQARQRSRRVRGAV